MSGSSDDLAHRIAADEGSLSVGRLRWDLPRDGKAHGPTLFDDRFPEADVGALGGLLHSLPHRRSQLSISMMDGDRSELRPVVRQQSHGAGVAGQLGDVLGDQGQESAKVRYGLGEQA